MTTDEFDAKIAEIGGCYTDESRRIACEIGDLEGMQKFLAVKDFNCSYYTSTDQLKALHHIVSFALHEIKTRKE